MWLLPNLTSSNILLPSIPESISSAFLNTFSTGAKVSMCEESPPSNSKSSSLKLAKGTTQNSSCWDEDFDEKSGVGDSSIGAGIHGVGIMSLTG